MGLFWEYFKKKLRLIYLSQAGPLALLGEGASKCLDEARANVLTLRNQFFPELCDEAFLANFARSRGIVQAPLETKAHYQGRVRFAYLWWTRGGRAGAMRLTLMEFFGFGGVTIIPLREEDPTRWAEFRVEIEVFGANLEVSEAQIDWAINEAKPARSKFAEAQYIYATCGAVPRLAVGLQVSEVVTIYPK